MIDRGALPRGLAATLIAALVTVHALAGYGSSGMPDQFRDLYWADAILRGAAWPVRGPPIYNSIELGPWWYYVTAGALWLGRSLAGAAAITSVLAALKYVLAWKLGCRLGDRWLGLCFAVALVVPGWSAAPLGFPTHTALVETTLLALALATLACRERFGAWRAVGFGLLASACLHAHPSTAALVAGAAIAVLWQQRQPRAFAAMTLSVAVAVATLLPPLLARDGAAVEFGNALMLQAASDWGTNPLLRALRLLAAVALGGGWHGALLWTQIPRGEWLALGVQGAALGLAAAGWLRTRRLEAGYWRLAMTALAIFAAQALFLVLIRPITPIWMIESLLPPFALALAAGWRALAQHTVRITPILALAMGAWLALGFAILDYFVGEIDVVRSGNGSNIFMDAGAAWNTGYAEDHYARLRIRRTERAVRHLCGRVALHGDLANADEKTFGAASRRACGDNDVQYAGNSPQHQHVAGYLAATWCAIGLRPSAIGAGFGFTEPRVLAPDLGAARPQPGPRQIDAIAGPLTVEPLSIRAVAPRDAVIALGKRYAWLHDFRLDAVRADGHSATLVHEDLATRFYRCDACTGTEAAWEFEATGSLAGIDIVALRDDPGGVEACGKP